MRSTVFFFVFDMRESVLTHVEWIKLSLMLRNIKGGAFAVLGEGFCRHSPTVLTIDDMMLIFISVVSPSCISRLVLGL